MNVPLYRRTISGRPVNQESEYAVGYVNCSIFNLQKTDGDEVEDLYEVLKEVKEKHPTVKGKKLF